MVKNTKGGKKCKKTKAIREETTLNYKTEGQEYGQVIKMLGNCRLEVYCFDGTTRMCQIRGKMRKRIFINKDDIVIVSLRDYQDAKGDIIEKYSETQKRALIDNGTIPDLDFNSMDIKTQIKNLKKSGDDGASGKPSKVEDGYYWTKNVSEDEEEDECKDIDFDEI
jgi:translation initiation factor 1A